MKKNSIISNYWDLIDYNVHHIQHSELKASLIITAYGLIFGLAYDVSGKFPIPENYKYLLYILILVLIVFTLTSILFNVSIFSAMPSIASEIKTLGIDFFCFHICPL